jgi:diaminopimelate epimerase
MNDVKVWDKAGRDFIFNTGSSHLVRFVDNIDDIDVVTEGRKIRYSKRFGDEGINVNFISLCEGHVKIRTYERGVEDETLACGTGAVASALVASLHNIKSPVTINAKGGELKVHFTKDKNSFTDIRLEGPAVFVYSGEINI